LIFRDSTTPKEAVKPRKLNKGRPKSKKYLVYKFLEAKYQNGKTNIPARANTYFPI
jgi:hypothetical protein